MGKQRGHVTVCECPLSAVPSLSRLTHWEACTPQGHGIKKASLAGQVTKGEEGLQQQPLVFCSWMSQVVRWSHKQLIGVRGQWRL